MDKARLVRLAQALFTVNAAVWLVLGAASLWRMGAGGDLQNVGVVVIAVLMLGNVGAMLLAGWGLGRASRLWYLFAWLVLVVNIVLTFTDQFGLLDLLTLILDLIIAGLLAATGKHLWNHEYA